MNMESTRRSLDRSRELGSKKPRLIDELSARQLPQRQQGSGTVTSLVSARARVNDRDTESSESSRGGGYQPQPQPHHELVTQYKTALAELTFNSKPIITNLTIIAGENQSAAKAIAATVCANILEVPSDQKLPSLYLLDSIVKNIGRDYIKYFAVRLPEVFCKAYRQVDPIVHSSMKHLFGTWKGVFPPQCLQMIEKELGFTPAVNGSASVSATVRSDLQSQRPPHSIHVNPKYLERQRLQQSSTSKGVVDDMTGALLKSNEDSERPNRALGASRPWLDPRINMLNNQHTQRDAFNDSVSEKSIDGSFGGSQYGSGISSNLVSGAGRTGTKLIDLGQEKTWSKTDGGDAETISGQKNGFSLKRSLSNREAPKSINLKAHRQPGLNLTQIWNNMMSDNWKNSEEEEFTWDEMNSGLTDHGPNVSSNLSTDSWMTDDENLEGEDHLHILHPYGEKVDREISTVKKQLPGFGGHPPSSWQLQKHHTIDKLTLKPGYSEGFVSTISGLPANASSLPVKKGNQSLTSKAIVGMSKIVEQQFDSGETESPSGQSPSQRQSPSLPGTVYHPHSMQNLPEQEMPQDHKTSQFLGGPTGQHIRDRSPTLHPVVQVGNMRRTQEKDMQGTFQPKLQSLQPDSAQAEVFAKTKLPQSKVSLTKGVSEQSTKNNLSAAAVKSGIIPKKSITSNLDPRKHLSKSGVQLPPSGRSSPATLTSSGSAVVSPALLDPLHKDSSSLPKKPQGKIGQPPQRLNTQPPASSNVNAAKNNVNPIANLLSSLVAKGLISAETESPTVVPSEVLKGSKDKTANISTNSSFPVTSVSDSAAVPASSARDEEDASTKSSLPSAQSTSTKIRNLIGFDFKPNVIREFHEPVIRELLDDFSHHCKICSIRFKQEQQYKRHLEWHATREHDPIKVSRSWYAKSSDWIAGKVEYSSELEFTDSVVVHDKETDSSQLDTMIRADENQCLCVLCGELFEDVYCHERNEWMFKGAVYMNCLDFNDEMESRNVGPIIHAKCLSENSIVTNLGND
ncbi:polyadenylation and cleavage factor homolog 4-like isoform X1 [Vigna umbellata]|uniref:polyadenylation and cleavage factor homolog 4-like isoform X1 n=2 Tax=Vigna umbellata TaxID=87088 RepID=UPI001F5F8383|nr:polyadenylation and cleavage factor homolog 4-like isoform X1 [Vigna umbellata]